MIVAALPLLCRRTDAAAALARDRRQGPDHLRPRRRVRSRANCAMTVGADVFSIRYVCGFGNDLPDGMVSFDDLFATDSRSAAAGRSRAAGAMPPRTSPSITFDVGEGGIVPVARSHAELLAGGLAVLLESGLAQDANHPVDDRPLLLCRHLPDAVALAAVRRHARPASPVRSPALSASRARDERCDDAHSARPGRFPSGCGGCFRRPRPVRPVIAAWRAPERLATSPAWRESDDRTRRRCRFSAKPGWRRRDAARGRQAEPDASSVRSWRRAAAADGVVGRRIDAHRRRHGGAARADGAAPHVSARDRSVRPALFQDRASAALVDTGYTCRVDSVTEAIVVTGPPSGMISVGGYRFPLQDLAGDRRPDRQRRHGRRAARSARRPTTHRQRRRSRHDAGGA